MHVYCTFFSFFFFFKIPIVCEFLYSGYFDNIIIIVDLVVTKRHCRSSYIRNSTLVPRSNSPNQQPTTPTITMASEAINLVAVIYPKPEKAAEVS